MRMPAERWAAIGLVAVALCAPAVAAGAEVSNITGSATALVVQYNGIVEVQRDSSQETVPQTISNPPAVARARLDHLLSDGSITAEGQVVAILDQPNLTGFGPPNDAGMDLGAFSDDTSTSWVVQGTVTERRTLVLGANELGGNIRFSNRGRAKSRLVLSGVMLLMSADATKDLSSVEVRLHVRVTQYPSNGRPVDLLDGTVALVGGPNGSIELSRGPGAFANASPLVFDFPEIIPQIPLVRAALFTGLEIPYEYEAVVDEAFDLEMSVDTLLQTNPGTGAAATFGTPQQGLASLFQRVKQSDGGQRLIDALSEKVDTTGAAYAQNSEGSVFPAPLPFCGTLGAEMAALAPVLAGCWLGRVGEKGTGRRPVKRKAS